MTAILLSACTVVTLDVGGGKTVHITTPATAVGGTDTIDCASLFTTDLFATVSGASDGNLLATKIAAGTTITLPGTNTEVKQILAQGY